MMHDDCFTRCTATNIKHHTRESTVRSYGAFCVMESLHDKFNGRYSKPSSEISFQTYYTL